MGEVKALDLRPQGADLVGAEGADVFEAGQLIYQLPVFEYRHLQLHRPEVLHGLALPAVMGVADLQGLGIVHRLVPQTDVVGLGHAGVPVEEAVHLLEAGVGDLAHVLADLDLGDDAAVLALHGAELVHAAENRVALGGDQPLAYAKGVDLCPLADQLGNQPLVQGIGNGDGALGPAGLIQHLSGLLGQIGHVAGVQPDAALGDAQGFQNIVEGPDGIGNAGFQGVEGVHQQHRVVGIGAAVADESVIFRVKHLYPGMGHGACRGHAVELVGHGAGCARAAADIGRSGAGYGPGDTLGPAGAKLQHSTPLGCSADPVGLGGDEALVVELQQHIGLQQLGLDGRGPDGDHRLPGEDGHALRHGPDIAGEAEIPQILQKFRLEELAPLQIADVLLGEMELLHIVHDLLQPCRDGVAALVGDAAVKNVKISDAIFHAVGQIAIAHGQLIEVTQHGKVDAGAALHKDHSLSFYL